MSVWGMDDVGAALPVKADPSSTVADEIKTRDPQLAGWVPPQAYDYATYNRTSDELRKESSEGISREWASNSTRYEWSDEYGDVGPAIPELELELFSSDRVQTGVQFDK
jgi:ATP-dependent RNA helicase DDX3X